MKANTTPLLRTPDEVRAWFHANGIAISQWCRDHQFARHTVVDLIRGRQRGLRGEAHRAAVALHMKAKPQSAAHYHKAKAR